MMLAHGNPQVFGTNNEGWGEMADMMREMMWPYQTGAGRAFWGFHWVLEFITWVLLIVLLVAASRYLWKKGDKVN